MRSAEIALAEANAAASALLGAPVDDIEQVRGIGRNSRIYRVRQGAESFAVKQYPSREQDPRDRLRTEVEALALMRRNGVEAVPLAIASDTERGYALLSWIDGGPVPTATETDIDAAAAFLAMTHELCRSDGAENQPLGAEACLSGVEIIAQLGRRLAALGAIATTEQALAAFLDRLSSLLFCNLLPRAQSGYDELGFSFARPLPTDSRSLCPSDFGFHNALRSPTGLVFIDFEYFGWDDPVKLVSDFLLHPGMNLAEPLKQRFVAAISPIYGGDPSFTRRLALLYPLFAMRWCLILLNEFLPERWANRVHAGFEFDWTEAKERQLARASDLLQSIEANDGGFPYGS
jgi:hypothetical protein